MRRTTITVAALLLLLVLLAAGWYVRRAPGGTTSTGTAVDQRAGSSTPEDAPLPASVEVALSVNRDQGITASQGTPILFQISLANHNAMNAKLENDRRAAQPSQLGGTAARALAVPAARFGSGDRAWRNGLSLWLETGGERRPLSWPAEGIGQAGGGALILDGTGVGLTTYGVEPDAMGGVAPGTYVIRAKFQSADAGAHGWTGEVWSNEVRVTIVPPAPDPDARARDALAHAEFLEARGDWTGAERWAREALQNRDELIPALILMGEARARTGDLRGALDSYAAALDAASRQYPDVYDPPAAIVDRMVSVRAKLLDAGQAPPR